MTKYREALPENCPPNNASDGPLSGVWRFINGTSPTDDDFHSHALLGKPNRNKAPQCQFASCSLFDTDAAKEMAKNQFFKKKLASRLDVQESSGRHIANNKGHVHFWMYEHFSPCSAVIETVKL